MKGVAHEIDYPVEYDAKKCNITLQFKSLSNGEWKVELDGAQFVGFIDRRQWNNDSASLQLCPLGGLQWSGKVSDGRTYTWKWTISRL